MKLSLADRFMLAITGLMFVIATIGGVIYTFFTLL